MELIINIDSNSIECDILLNEFKNSCYHITITITKKELGYLELKKNQKPRSLQNLIICDLAYGWVYQGIIIECRKRFHLGNSQIEDFKNKTLNIFYIKITK